MLVAAGLGATGQVEDREAAQGRLGHGEIARRNRADEVLTAAPRAVLIGREAEPADHRRGQKLAEGGDPADHLVGLLGHDDHRTVAGHDRPLDRGQQPRRHPLPAGPEEAFRVKGLRRYDVQLRKLHASRLGPGPERGAPELDRPDTREVAVVEAHGVHEVVPETLRVVVADEHRVRQDRRLAVPARQVAEVDRGRRELLGGRLVTDRAGRLVRGGLLHPAQHRARHARGGRVELEPRVTGEPGLARGVVHLRDAHLSPSPSRSP